MSARHQAVAASLVVNAPWLLGLRGSLPRLALDQLHGLLRTSEEI